MTKKSAFIFICILLVWQNFAFAQRKCGIEGVKNAMIAKDPSWAQRFEAQRTSLQDIADHYKMTHKPGPAAKTTTADTIPVVFHVIVNTAQFDKIGGYAGIQQRVESQIAVLNEDYNRGNADSTLIPYGWKPLFASTGIRFGLAHTQPNGYGTPGFEIKIIPSDGFYGLAGNNSYSDAKHSVLASGALSFSPGLDAWDVAKYLNIWCINFSDASGILGVTVAKSFTTGPSPLPADEIGVCINYTAFGRRASPHDYYMPGTPPDSFDRGRTLTHELGHFFEIWHTWGDDAGNCPWSGGHKDDGLADTPPEAGPKYDNYPDTVLGGTCYDACRFDGATDTQFTSYGVARLDYMNYTDDIGLHLFTPDQAAVMASQIAPGGEHHTLTQNPVLLTWPANTGIAQPETNNGLQIFPNPATREIHIVFDNSADELKEICVFNAIGNQVQNVHTATQQKNHYSIDLPGMSKGIYFVRCNFASGSITRKILLQ